ncbi:acyl-CoA dehydrogenase family protein [Actinosynnema sp. NPDC091369]
MSRSAATSDVDLLREADRPGFTEHLHFGAVRWDLVHPFPATGRGRRVADEVVGVLRELVDPEQVDVTRELPAGVLPALGARGLLNLAGGPETGGHGLGQREVFDVVEAAVAFCPAVGLAMAVDNALGYSAYLPVLPDGPLREWVRDRVVAGVVSCTADTEPSGAHNSGRSTTATPVPGGFRLDGRKIHVGNAPEAGAFVVTATLGDELRLFFLDAATPGVTITARHDFLGLSGFPNGSVEFDGAFVPAEQVLVEPEHAGRLTPVATRLVVLGRMHLIAAPSLAFARLAARFAASFVARRAIDGRPLGDYPEIRRQLAVAAADVFATETAVEWSLADHVRVNPLYEQLAAKNIASLASWRVVDRALSIMAAEGLETAGSKAGRGADASPLERAFRDARAMRVSGGIDFQLDNWAGRHLLTGYYEGGAVHDVVPDLSTLTLSARNAGHARFVADQARRLASTCAELTARHPREELFERERTVILLSRVVNELVAMALVLARASTEDRQDVADVFCTSASFRVHDSWHQLGADEPDYAAVLREGVAR